MIKAVFFSTSTCGHCRPFKQIFEDVAEMYDEDELEVTYRVVDKEEDSYALFKEWQLTAVPSVLIIKDGVAEDAHRIVGAIPKNQLIDIIQAHLG